MKEYRRGQLIEQSYGRLRMSSQHPTLNESGRILDEINESNEGRDITHTGQSNWSKRRRRREEEEEKREG